MTLYRARIVRTVNVVSTAMAIFASAVGIPKFVWTVMSTALAALELARPTISSVLVDLAAISSIRAAVSSSGGVGAGPGSHFQRSGSAGVGPVGYLERPGLRCNE